jgi:hypothetical protein
MREKQHTILAGRFSKAMAARIRAVDGKSLDRVSEIVGVRAPKPYGIGGA